MVLLRCAHVCVELKINWCFLVLFFSLPPSLPKPHSKGNSLEGEQKQRGDSLKPRWSWGFSSSNRAPGPALVIHLREELGEEGLPGVPREAGYWTLELSALAKTSVPSLAGVRGAV